MKDRIIYGVGAHEPIFHRMRTGNATAEEWRRWERETSTENLDLLSELGVSHVHISCCKGFGLEYEKPIIERAARFAENAAARGITTGIYVQGFPVYYETFLLETPEAEDWLARRQDGGYVPWGGQTFRRWMDPTRREFHEYQWRLLEHVLRQFTPVRINMDNTAPPPCWTHSARESFRNYLREKFADVDPVVEFGIPGFEAVDLPRFDPVYWPRDAYGIIKDPILQEWARWRSRVVSDFLAETRRRIRSLAPETTLGAVAGCDGLRYNHLFANGVDLEERMGVVDAVGMEESGWRPGTVERAGDGRRVVMDERVGESARAGESDRLRVSTDARFCKIRVNYGLTVGSTFWGEVDRPSKLVALSHSLAFSNAAENLGLLGPLAASKGMLDDLADAIEWARDHVGVLTGRETTVSPVAVWRGQSTCAFIRHRPVWQACAVEQMLFENHVPFTILLDGGLERFLPGRKVLVLPGTACVSDRQAEIITAFVRDGGSLLLLGAAGTRDERTRLRQRHAFGDLFGGEMPNLEHFGPPHWVPELNFDAMPDRLSIECGAGKVAFVKAITPQTELDLTRDPYMPERQVAPRDILPPANELVILAELNALLGDDLGAAGPRWTLCEYWKRGSDLLICCANLRKGGDGGPLTVRLGPHRPSSAVVHVLLQPKPVSVPVRDGKIEIESLPHFCAIEVPGVL